MYSFSQIVKSLPKKKNSKSSLWVKLFIRRISFPFTYIFINIGFSAWMASVFSIFIAMLGCLFLSLDFFGLRIIGVILINFWLILDCVDGNIARVRKTSSTMGEFIDAQSGYYISGFIYFSFGIAAYNTLGSRMIFGFDSNLLIIIGAVASISNILTRLIHQKYLNSIINNQNTNTKGEKESKISFLRSRFDKELGLSGLLMPFLIGSLIFDNYIYITIFYFVFSVIALLSISLLYSYKAKGG